MTTRISSSASCAPTQNRRPPPNGIHALSAAPDPSPRNRSGRNVLGSGNASGSWWMSAMSGAVNHPAGTSYPPSRNGASTRRGAS